MKLALAGDTMLGRGVGERLAGARRGELFSDDVVAAAREADLLVLNLECAVSERGIPFPDPDKPFFFRAPPSAVEALRDLGVGCVTLANNHALDFGAEALLDTFAYLSEAGIAWVGAGADEGSARRPVVLERAGERIAIVGVTDHPREYAAAAGRPGVAYADLRAGPPDWLLDVIGGTGADLVLVSPHWGPNMATEPVAHVRRAAAAFRDAGATLVAGHSAHVFQGVAPGIVYDLGDFIDDYATDPLLRNDLGLLFLVTFEHGAPVRLEAVPLALDFCHTRLARPDETAWIARRLSRACSAFGTEVTERDGRFLLELAPPGSALPLHPAAARHEPAPRGDR